MWEVLYTDEFGAWFETLTEDQQDAVIARVDLLEAEGPALGRPTVDTIAGIAPSEHEGTAGSAREAPSASCSRSTRGGRPSC